MGELIYLKRELLYLTKQEYEEYSYLRNQIKNSERYFEILKYKRRLKKLVKIGKKRRDSQT